MSIRIPIAITIAFVTVAAWFTIGTPFAQAHHRVPYFQQQQQVEHYPTPPRHHLYPYRRFKPYFRPYVRGYDINQGYQPGAGKWVKCSHGGIPRGAKVMGYNNGDPFYRCKAMYRGVVYYGDTYGTKCYIRYNNRFFGLPIYKVLVR